jgi:hypothetical protein
VIAAIVPERKAFRGQRGNLASKLSKRHIVFLFVCGLLLFLQSAGREECEKSKQPKNDQNRSDYRDYVFMSLSSGSENI